MKKILIAATLAAAAFAASAQVTVYGKINATVDNTRTGSAAAVASIVNDTSRIGVRVTEDLGNGMSARAVVETAINSQDPVAGNATQLGDRQSTVGLANRFGSVDLGRNLHGVFTTVLASDAFAAAYGSVAGDVHNMRNKRIGNGVFVSLTALPGVKVGLERSLTATGTETTIVTAGTTLGPVDATVVRYEQGAEKTTIVGATTQLGTSKVFYSYSDNQGVVASKGHLVGVSQAFGAYTAKASVGDTNTGVRAYNLGVDYALSKRTVAGVSYRNVNAATDIRQVGVGITHHF